MRVFRRRPQAQGAVRIGASTFCRKRFNSHCWAPSNNSQPNRQSPTHRPISTTPTPATFCLYLQSRRLLAPYYRKLRKNRHTDPTGIDTLKDLLQTDSARRHRRRLPPVGNRPRLSIISTACAQSNPMGCTPWESPSSRLLLLTSQLAEETSITPWPRPIGFVRNLFLIASSYILDRLDDVILNRFRRRQRIVNRDGPSVSSSRTVLSSSCQSESSYDIGGAITVCDTVAVDSSSQAGASSSTWLIIGSITSSNSSGDCAEYSIHPKFHGLLCCRLIFGKFL